MGSNGVRGLSTDAVLMINKLVIWLKLLKPMLDRLVQEGEIPDREIGWHCQFNKNVIGRSLGDDEQPAKGK